MNSILARGIKKRTIMALALCVAAVSVFIVMAPKKAHALPSCFDSNTAIPPASNFFPRTGIAKDASAGCADVPQTAGMANFTDTDGTHVLLSSYYATGAGSPGSTLHTPNASFTLFATSQPTVAQQVVIFVWWCRGGLPTPVLVSKGVNPVGFGTQVVTFLPSEFSQSIDATTGTSVWKTDQVIASVDPAAQMICKINAVVPTAEAFVSFTAESSLTNISPATNGIPQRYNQVNWTVDKQVLGPPGVGAGTGAFALRTDLTSTDQIEYAFDFRPDCSISGPTSIWLKYYDADAPSGANPFGTTNPSGDGYPRTLLYEYDSAGTLINTINLNGQPDYEVTTGNDEFGEWGITVQPGHRYRWVWWNIGAANGLQVWMPFSEFTALPGFTCGKSPVGFADSCTLVGTSTIIRGWAYDNDANAGDGLPQTALNVGGVGQTVSANVGGYRNGPIDTALNAFGSGSGPARDGQYGWTATYNGFTKGNSYGISGTVINVGPGSDQGLGINTGNTLDGVPVFGFPGNVIPQECLPPPPAPIISCGIVTPASAQPSQLINVTVSFSNSGNADLLGATLNVTINGVAQGSIGFGPNPNVVPFAPPGNVATSNPIPFNTPVTAGTVPVSWTITGGNAPANPGCNGVIRIIAKPYFKVYGGDVRAGSGYAPTCGAPAAGLITAWGSSSGLNNGTGASTQYAAIAARGIDGFSTANGRLGDPGSPIGLTFANNVASNSLAKPFGGDFGGSCMPDYWNSLQNSPGVGAGGAVNLAQNGQFKYTGGGGCAGGVAHKSAPKCYTISASATSSRLAVFIDGDLNITGNITYGAAASVATLPYITVVTCGNIYIDKSVTNISGWFIAVPRANCGGPSISTGGNIYTCTNGFQLVAAASMYDNTGIGCRNILTVRGSFAANDIKFWRTTGTLSAGLPVDPIGSANVAERFIYGPEMWMNSPFTAPSTTPTKFDSITGLPPIL